MTIKLLEQCSDEQKTKVKQYIKTVKIYQTYKQAVEELKAELFELLNNCKVLDADDNTTVSITSYKQQKKTLNPETLKHYINEELLDKCYDVKEVDVYKITLNPLNKE